MKFYGEVGYGFTKQTGTDVWTEEIVTRMYYGDVIRNHRQVEKSAEQINDHINVNNQISVVADPFMEEHFFAIRYVEWMGTKWKVTGVEVQRPRLILSIGGVYNGDN